MEKMEQCDVLLIIGTQLTTGGPRSMVRAAQKSGAIIIRMDPEVDLADDSTAGMLHIQGCLGRILAVHIQEKYLYLYNKKCNLSLSLTTSFL